MRFVRGFLAASLLLGSAGLVLADQPGADWISADQARAKLAAAGYSNVTKIEADDGHWEGTGVKNGQVHEFHVDPRSGNVTRDEMDRVHGRTGTPGADWISEAQARAKLAAAGYTSVTKIEADDGHWEGTGVKNGQVHEFHVDPRSGNIIKDELDR